MATRVPPTKAELDIQRVSRQRRPRSVVDLQIILNESKPTGDTRSSPQGSEAIEKLQDRFEGGRS